MTTRRPIARRRRAKSIERDVAQLADDLRTLGSSLGSSASEEARASLQALSRRIEALAAKGGETTQAGLDGLKESVRETPLGSLAAALAAGFVLGALFRR